MKKQKQIFLINNVKANENSNNNEKCFKAVTKQKNDKAG